MAHPDIPASFIFTQLTPEEEIKSRQLTHLQILALKNDEALAMRGLSVLEYDPQNPLRFAQDQATLRAQIQYIQFLLAQAEFATTSTTYTPTNDGE